jgi:hypothetical protein
MVSYERGNVKLLKPERAEPFSDFVALERWLAMERSPAVDAERQYFESVEQVVKDAGYYDRLLAAQATDKEFLVGWANLVKAGFRSKESEKMIAAFSIETALQAELHPEKAHLMLKHLANRYS